MLLRLCNCLFLFYTIVPLYLFLNYGPIVLSSDFPLSHPLSFSLSPLQNQAYIRRLEAFERKLRAEPAAAHADLKAFQQQQQWQVQGDQISHNHLRQSGRLTPDSVHDGGVVGKINNNYNGSSSGGHENTAPLAATSSSSSAATHSTARRSGTLNLSAVRDVYAAAAGLPSSSSSHYDTNRSDNSGVEESGVGKGKWPRLAAAVVWVILVLLVAIVGSVSFYLVTAVLFPIKARSVVTTMTISVLLQVRSDDLKR